MTEGSKNHETGSEPHVIDRVNVVDYFVFVFFCVLLIIPIYAIVRSVIERNWLMVVVDIILVPVGFVHGILMLAGVV